MVRAGTSADDINKVPDYGLEPRENDYAVIVGIEKYRGEIPQSDFSAEDAKLMRDYLIALGFRPVNIKLMINEFATRDDIAAAVESWLPRRVKPESTVFFYYSGHGATDVTDPSKPRAFLVPYNGDPNDLAYSGYSIDTLKDKLSKLKASQVIVMLDSCFSGMAGKGKPSHTLIAEGARPLISQFTQVSQVAANMAMLTATKSNQISTSDPEKGHGVMTYYFLKALRDGKTSLAEIYKAIKPSVQDEAMKIQGSEQTPELVLGDPERKGEFILADPEKIIEAKKRLEEANSEKARMKRMEEDRKKFEAEKLEAQKKAEEAQRKAQEAQAEADRKLQEQKDRLDREHAERQAEQQRQFEAEKRRLEKLKKAPPREEPVYVPPTF